LAEFLQLIPGLVALLSMGSAKFFELFALVGAQTELVPDRFQMVITKGVVMPLVEFLPLKANQLGTLLFRQDRGSLRQGFHPELAILPTGLALFALSQAELLEFLPELLTNFPNLLLLLVVQGKRLGNVLQFLVHTLFHGSGQLASLLVAEHLDHR